VSKAGIQEYRKKRSYLKNVINPQCPITPLPSNPYLTLIL